ncbi:MAG: hypothetical protein ABGX00_02435, partial [Allomuricauda sp.]
ASSLGQTTVQGAIDVLAASNAADLDTDPNNEIQDAAGVAFDDTASSLGQTTVQGAIDVLAASNAADLDTDPNNEIQDAAGVAFDDTASSLGQTTVQGAIDALAASNAADNDTNSTNEIQNITAGSGITVTPTGQDFEVAVTNPIIATGVIIGGVDNSSGASVTDNGSGSYTVNLSITPSNYVVQLTTIGNAGARTIQVTTKAANQFGVQIYDGAGTISNSDWNYTVISF